MNQVEIKIDGKIVNFTEGLGYPFASKTQRTMVPIRIISENMGYKVDWNEDMPNKVWISDSKTKIEIEIGSTTAIVNGKVVPIDVQNGKPVDTKSVVIKNRTYVPIRFISEAMGAEVRYERGKDGTHFIDIITKVQGDSKVIEPKFYVAYYNKSGNSTYFTIYIENFMDYKGTNATFSPELVSHPQYYEYKSPDLFEAGVWVVFTREETLKIYANKVPNYDDNSFFIYKFILCKYDLDITTGKSFVLPKDGEIMKVKVIVKMNGQSKDYFVDVPFLNKDRKQW